MTEIDRIIDQLQRAFKKDSWSGPSLQEVLANVTAECAAARPAAVSHVTSRCTASCNMIFITPDKLRC